MHGMRASDRIGRGFREPEVQHLALGDELGHGSRGVFDGGATVYAVLVVEVDVVGAQAIQRTLDCGTNVCGAAVYNSRSAVGVRDETELRGDLHLVAATSDRTSDDPLTVERSVDFCRVDVGDA